MYLADPAVHSQFTVLTVLSDIDCTHCAVRHGFEGGI